MQHVPVSKEVLVQWTTRDAGHPTVLYGEISGVLLKVMPVKTNLNSISTRLASMQSPVLAADESLCHAQAAVGTNTTYTASDFCGPPANTTGSLTQVRVVRLQFGRTCL